MSAFGPLSAPVWSYGSRVWNGPWWSSASSRPFGQLGANLAVAGVGRIFRPRTRSWSRRSEMRPSGRRWGFFVEQHRESLMVKRPSPQGASRPAPAATALSRPRQADIRSPHFGMEPGGSQASAQTGVGRGTMKICPEKLAAEAEATGFEPDMLEKVTPSAWIAGRLAEHPFVKVKLVLKGDGKAGDQR